MSGEVVKILPSGHGHYRLEPHRKRRGYLDKSGKALNSRVESW